MANNKSKKVVVAVKAAAAPSRRKRRTRRNRNGRNGSGAPVSTPVSIAPKNTERVRLKGTDRLIHVDDVSKFASGDVVVDISLSCDSFKRMEHMAEAYQRVRFKKLVFRVVPMSATSTTGGFAAAFVSDPTDALGIGSDALDRLVAQKGSKITKIWQTATINACLCPDLLYTSEPPQGDIRLSSPGRLWVVIESRPVGVNNTAVPLTVYCDWEVEFFVPSLEKSPDGGVGTLISQANFYTRSSNVGLWFRDTAGGDDPRTAVPGIEFNVVYKTKNKYYLSFDKAGNFDKFVMVNDAVHGVTFCPVSPDGTKIIAKTDINQWCIEKGDTLTPVPALNSVGVEYLCHRTQRLSLLAQCKPPPAPSLQESLPTGSSNSKPTQSSVQSRTRDSSKQAPTRAQLLALLTDCQSKFLAPSRSPSCETLDDEFDKVFHQDTDTVN